MDNILKCFDLNSLVSSNDMGLVAHVVHEVISSDKSAHFLLELFPSQHFEKQIGFLRISK